jgi:UDP-glucose 4-epimerase
MGYDPMLQFIHEIDVARALGICLESDRSGVYNLVGEGSISYTRAIELCGSTGVPIPHVLVYNAVGLLSKFGVGFPKHLTDYFRYPTIVSDVAFKRDFNFTPEVSTMEALKSIRRQSA